MSETQELQSKNGEIEYSIGVDMGGTNLKFVAVQPNGSELARAHTATEDLGTSEVAGMIWRRKIRAQAELWTQQFGVPQSVGLSAPGLAARDERSISFMPGRLYGLENLVWSEVLGVPVVVLNDAHAALLGEMWRGAAVGLQNVFMLTLGTGVGGAIVADGRLLRGAIGRAGHLGHISLNAHGTRDIVNTPGSLEDAIGDCTVKLRSHGRFASTCDLVQAHLYGDRSASEIWLRSVEALACGIASLVNVLDSEAVVLGGGIMAAGDALLQPLHAFLEDVEWRPGGHRVDIKVAQLGDFAGALGAAKYARDKQ